MAPILTTERTSGRRVRIGERRAARPACARSAGAPEMMQARGPFALGRASEDTEAFGEVSPVVAPRLSTRHASAATFRRRRLLALLGLIGAVVIVGQAGAALGGPSLGLPTHAPAVHRYVVRAGDSLWGAASRLAPNDDPRAVVDALVHARGSGPLMPGEVLRWLG